jgi:hypothetical protein
MIKESTIDSKMQARHFCSRTAFVLVAAMAMLFALAASSASAATPGPGWSISSLAEPTNFNASDTQNTIEELVVAEKGGSGSYELFGNGRAIHTVPIKWDATALEVQGALEAVPSLSSGLIGVTGGPSAAPPYVYTLSWYGPNPGVRAMDEAAATEEERLFPKWIEPTFVQEGAVHDQYTITALNVGSLPSSGEVTVTDKLPRQVLPTAAEIKETRSGSEGTCEVGAQVRCTYINGEETTVAPGGQLLVTITVLVKPGAPERGVVNEATVSGGGHSASTTEASDVNVGAATFGISQFAFEAGGLDGALDGQAGDHPFGVTTTLDFNTVLGSKGRPYSVVQDAREIAVTLPAGFYGDPLAAAQCPEVALTSTLGSAGGPDFRTRCPAASQVGTVRLLWEGGIRPRFSYPLYNLVPEPGYPAELGFNAAIAQPIFLYAGLVPSPSGYRLRIATPGVLRAVGVEGVSVTIFGSPAEHNRTGGAAAFLTNPAACSVEPARVGAEVSSWEGGSATAESIAYPDLIGCNLLQGAAAFDPTIAIKPETTQADTPSGYEVDLKLPQAPNVFGALATPELKNATVTLPAGVSVSPSAASGPDALEGCTEAQIDLLGTELGEGHPGGNNSPYDDGLTHASPGNCPENSRIGEVEVKTPLLEEPLHGHVYLAEPHCGGAGQAPCSESEAEEGKVFGLYLEMAGSGVIVKLGGSVEVGGYGGHNDLAPGQLRARFDNNPQLPFANLKMTFTGGQRAPLANPQTCGTFTTTSELEPWSAPESGPNATPSWPFAVTGCAGGFAPAFSAGTVTPLAGAYSPFTLTFSRHDGEQDLSGIAVQTPAGLLGKIAGVPECGEVQANAGTCGPESQIGTTTVASGSGSEPLYLTGRVYLTGPYAGGPFGLSIVVPAVAGPFNLGNVVVRASIAINPNTAAITTTSNPLPQLIDGVPTRLQTVNVTLNRPGFIFNPTNCSQQTVAGTITSAQGASVGTSSPFAVAGCATLPFAPKLSASVAGHASKREGAAFDVKITSAGLGQANIHKVDLTIPATLPSRLSTLQKACLAATFESNPAACSPESIIGKATIHTPLLNVPLSGPAYIVSHGGAAFPDVEFVLQGEGVTLILDGETEIKSGITYSRFETAPDAPFTTFETELPAGPKSILGAYASAKEPYNLCKANLAMPTEITGQNGAVIKQTTAIAATGCPPTLSITKTKVKGNTVLVTVKLGVAGTVKITGKGLKTTTKKGVRAGTHTITVPLTNTGRAAEKHKKKLKIEATLSVAGRTGTATTTLKA